MMRHGALILTLSIVAGSTLAQEGLVVPDNPVRGWLVFEGKHCNQCHGIAGMGPGIGPDLGEERFAGTFLELGAAMWSHVPGMSVRFEEAGLPWPEISHQEAIELTSFLYFTEYLGHPGDPATGRRLFSSRGCSACHTVGEARVTRGPDLAGLRRYASPLYLAQAMWNHGPEMLATMRRLGIPQPIFEEGDLAHLNAFIRQAAQPDPRERQLLTPGNLRRGREVFESKGCITCHAVHGRGGQIGPDLSDSDLQRSAEAIASTMWNHALEMGTYMQETGVAWPHFNTTELADLTSFLYFLPFVDPPGDQNRGAQVFATKACADCHSGFELSDHPGPDLGDSQAITSPARLVAAMWNHAPIMGEAILGEGRPWPELDGADLRDLLAFLGRQRPAP